MIKLYVLVDGEVVADVPLWMIKHAVEDAVSMYPAKRISVEVFVR